MRNYIQGWVDASTEPRDASGWLKSDISDLLDGVLKRDAHEFWWDVPIPRVENKTPNQLWDEGPDGRLKVIAIVCDYLDPGFS